MKRSSGFILQSLLVVAALLLVLAANPVAAVDCIADFGEIDELEALVNDTSVLRTYKICPYKLLTIGTLDFDNNLVDDDGSFNPPLPLRPNMHVLCGDNGSKSNLCFVRDGYLQLDGTSKRNIQDPTLDNIVIEGFVFVGAHGHSLHATKPGSITFRNCEWREFKRSKAPIMLDFYDAFATDELVVSFERCMFRSNRYFGDESYAALIYGNSDQNRLIMERSTFQSNDMVHNNTRADTNSFLIETLGPTCIDRGCFIDNEVGTANVAVFGSQFVSSQTYTSNSNGGVCAFASSFQSIQQYKDFAPLCINSMAQSCSYDLELTVKEKPCVGWVNVVEDYETPDPVFSKATLSPSVASFNEPSDT